MSAMLFECVNPLHVAQHSMHYFLLTIPQYKGVNFTDEKITVLQLFISDEAKW